MSVARLLQALSILCGVAGAMGCGKKPPASPVTPEIISRREVQRSSLRADTWQFMVCGADARLAAHVDSLAIGQSFGKTVTVVDCEDALAGVPTIVFGDHLPQGLSGLIDVFGRPPIAYGPGDVLVVNNYLQPTSDDRQPSTVSVFIAPTTDALLGYLQSAEYSDWGGIFRGRWAYEVYSPEGGVRYGTYQGSGWQFDAEAEITLAPVGPVIYTAAGVAYYSVDRAITASRLKPLLDSLASDPSDLPVRRVYIYPNVSSMGLRRGSMEARQSDGDALHLALSELEPRPAAPSLGNEDFFRGMTFAHEGYRVYNGYGGTTVAPALDSLLSLSVNAIAIVPYTFMPDAATTGALPVPTDAQSENDGAVTFSIREAHKRGVSVMLKPQIWVGGGWPGDIAFSTDAEWEDFFTKYERWITHYAVMAEGEKVAALCIGTELVQTTLGYPARWRSMITAIRKVYGGKLTYAANWGTEFEQLTFWADLDVIGLNSYYPLANDPGADDAALLAGATAWMHLADSIARHYDRPLWLTEVGYRSVAAAWINPHAEAGDRPEDFEAQARSYRALAGAAIHSAHLRGMFIWKWPSYLGREAERGEATGFTPGGKPAEQVLTDFYRQVR